jgi:thiamine-phosphate pyrophosphorylase
MKLAIPKLYVILDAILLGNSPLSCAEGLMDCGVEFLQYRNKRASSRELFAWHRELESLARPRGARIVVNDRPDIAAVVGAGGLHVGQEDLGVEQARRVVGDGCLIGVSTHNEEQLVAATGTSADYIAIGPVFATRTKDQPDPVVGLEFVSRARQLTDKPLVAIGGITVENVHSVWQAGADCVAVARDVLCAAHPGRRAQEFLALAPPRFGR